MPTCRQPTNLYDQIVGPPEPSPDIRFGCVGDASFISNLTPGHIFERHCPHPQPTAKQPTLPIGIETHVPLSSLSSNPDYRREDKTTVNSANAIFEPDGPFILLKTSKESKARRTPSEGGGGGVLVARDTTSAERTNLHMTHFAIAGEYAGTPPTSLIPRHYGYGVLKTAYSRRGYSTYHTRTDDDQADLFLAFPFAQHTRNGVPTRLDKLLLSYQHRPVLTHQDILDDYDSNMIIRRQAEELLIQRHGTSPMTPPLNTPTHGA